ncbi:hypothetical protein FRACYDRAFT_241440 [Fragilariopsis cylindrus CCMP1102]|uniref:Uncharacterized protein n=1 Tax=Fragilariopsis cylindrus CCMP1102 TaxID=635003 RepID=A0A1E7F9R9_9STRA|nr:hypothetical protein FRACYDRAFT_241440 [Fragilariopsis cylindrus CCMP1102]|eukprot:OEU14884.1 hypothetical protein FRACYDRAFT_241440 [Fragilariopsis cylindrus CCMP1102]
MTTVNTADYDNSRNHTSNKIDDWIENATRNGSLFIPNQNQIQIKPSQVLNTNNDNSNDGNSNHDCGNGLFCRNTNGIKCHELLFSISVRHNVITVTDSFNDIDCGDAFKGLSRIGLDTVAFAGYLSKCYICDLLHTEQQQQQQQQETEEEEDQDHILWWHDTDSDSDSDDSEATEDECNDDSISDDDIDLFCGSIIENEANGIISDVNGAMKLLIDILEPILIKKFGDTTDSSSDSRSNTTTTNNISNLLPNIIRGAFVILMSRSFDESLFGDDGEKLYEFGIRFGFVPGEIKDIQALLKEKNPIFFPTSKI